MTVLGQQLRVEVRAGTDHGRPPLLLCNGIGAALEVLNPFVQVLDPGLSVIRFDAPGVGGSPTPPVPYALPQVATVIGRMLDAIGLRGEVDVLGVSWGGVLAQQLALQEPRRCRRLVLVATSPGVTMVPGRLSTVLQMLAPHRPGEPGGAPGDVVTVDHGRSASGCGYFYQLAAAMGWTTLPLLPFLQQPTLLLAGADDPVVPVINARIMARLLPDARLHVHPDGHLALITRAAELAPLVEKFLAERRTRWIPTSSCTAFRP